MPSVLEFRTRHKTDLIAVLLPSILAIEDEWRTGDHGPHYRSLLRQAHIGLGQLYEFLDLRS